MRHPLSARMLLLVAAGGLGLPLPSPGADFVPITLTPADIRLEVDASRPGAMALANLAGDLGKPGLYAVRIRMPAQLQVQPHVHPDDRMVVVLSGTLLVGFGEQFDASRMHAMPPGSFFVEPARAPHFAWVKGEDVVVQVSGIGPSGTVYLNPASPGH